MLGARSQVTRFGGYTTCLLAATQHVRHLPSNWSFEEGAAFLCTAMTAWFVALHTSLRCGRGF